MSQRLYSPFVRNPGQLGEALPTTGGDTCGFRNLVTEKEGATACFPSRNSTFFFITCVSSSGLRRFFIAEPGIVSVWRVRENSDSKWQPAGPLCLLVEEGAPGNFFFCPLPDPLLPHRLGASLCTHPHYATIGAPKPTHTTSANSAYETTKQEKYKDRADVMSQ